MAATTAMDIEHSISNLPENIGKEDLEVLWSALCEAYHNVVEQHR